MGEQQIGDWPLLEHLMAQAGIQPRRVVFDDQGWLRILDLSGLRLAGVPEGIGQLKHLQVPESGRKPIGDYPWRTWAVERITGPVSGRESSLFQIAPLRAPLAWSGYFKHGQCSFLHRAHLAGPSHDPSGHSYGSSTLSGKHSSTVFPVFGA